VTVILSEIKHGKTVSMLEVLRGRKTSVREMLITQNHMDGFA